VKRRDATPYDETAAQRVLDRLALGETLSLILAESDMPSRAVVSRWRKERQDFAARFQAALEAGADFCDEAIRLLTEKCTPGNATATRVKIDALRWRAAHLHPARFGRQGEGSGYTPPSTEDMLEAMGGVDPHAELLRRVELLASRREEEEAARKRAEAEKLAAAWAEIRTARGQLRFAAQALGLPTPELADAELPQ
jgi:hypothetical protein